MVQAEKATLDQRHFRNRKDSINKVAVGKVPRTTEVCDKLGSQKVILKMS